MIPIVEINTEYIDENGVQHIDGYTSKADDAEGTVVAYFVNGEAYYTNPDYRFDELVKATVDGLKAELNKTIQSKYKHVVESLNLLQIEDNAISHVIVSRMVIGLAFKDADKTLGERIYYGSVFQDILDNHKEGFNEINEKFLPELNDLIELAKDYQYLMIPKI